MVEPTHQNRCTGKGFKPPKGAVLKRYGAERLGKGFATWSGMDKGDELTVTAEEVSRSGHILSKAVEYVMQ